MGWVLDIPVLAFLGIQFRYWAIIIVVIIVLLVLAIFARRRSIS
jgi:VIT1/CCC1 family predicted Fe2+/Mn2+ transporter